MNQKPSVLPAEEALARVLLKATVSHRNLPPDNFSGHCYFMGIILIESVF
jgi:hypothetical protein